MSKRSAFFISDSTGITAEMLGNALLSQFEGVEFDKYTVPYVNSMEKAEALVDRINAAALADGAKPIVLDTVVDHQIRALIASSQCFSLDVFQSFLVALENELQTRSSYAVGRSHLMERNPGYDKRIQAVHYALDADDGAKLDQYQKADLILVGVSRSGKTPTCLYLGLHYGVFAANYPITEDDLDSNSLPRALAPFRAKMYGLTIEPERLSAIRQERRANSRYASLIQCENELRLTESLMQRHGIPVIDTTHRSVEEIATKILADTGIKRQL